MAFRSSQTIAQVIAQSLRSRQGRKRTAEKDLQMLETNFFEGEGKKRRVERTKRLMRLRRARRVV